MRGSAVLPGDLVHELSPHKNHKQLGRESVCATSGKDARWGRGEGHVEDAADVQAVSDARLVRVGVVALQHVAHGLVSPRVAPADVEVGAIPGPDLGGHHPCCSGARGESGHASLGQ